MGTINNFTDEDITRMTNLSTGSVTRMRVCKEVGEEGTPHLQWMVTFQRGYRFEAVKKLLPAGAHIEVAKCKDVDVYCSKGEIIIDVNNGCQGSRVDIAATYAAAKAGKRLRDFLDMEPSWQQIQIFQKAAAIYSVPRELPDGLEFLWFHGATGTGKSRTAFAYDGAYVKGSTGKFWDGYDGQETVIIDDVTDDSPYFDKSTWLRITDRYPVPLEIKGATVQAQFKRLIVTSNLTPKQFWDRMEWDFYSAFERRITEIREFVAEVIDLCD